MTRTLESLARCLLAAALAAGVAHGAVAPAKSAPAVGLESYLAELERWSAAAARLSKHPDEAAGLLKDLPPNWPVAVDREEYRVPTDWLRTLLTRYPNDPRQAAARSREIVGRLETLEAGAQTLRATPPLDASSARRSLRAILARREFAAVKPPSPVRSWWKRAWDGLVDELRSVFGRLGTRPGVPIALAWLLGVGLAAVLATWLVRIVLGGSGQRRALEISGPVAVELWRDWAAKAAASAARGDFREAVHLAYWTAVLRLEEAGLWQADRSRTPREYLRLVPAGYAQAAPLAELTRRFERTWYGGRTASAEDFTRAVADLEKLECRLRWNPETANS